MLPSARKLRRVEEAARYLNRRRGVARKRAAKTRHPYDLGREAGLREATKAVELALRSRRSE